MSVDLGCCERRRTASHGLALVMGLAVMLGVGCRAGQPVVFPSSEPFARLAPSPSVAEPKFNVTREKPSWAGNFAPIANRPKQGSATATGFESTAIQQISFEHPFVSLAEWIKLAIERNPEIEAARQEIEMASAKIPQVASLGDPMVDLITWPIFPNVEQQAGGRMIADVMVSQEVPWKGKRESRVGQASGEVNRLQSKLIAAELKVANEVQQAVIDLWLATQQLEIVQSDRLLLEGLTDLAETRYEAGSGGQQDILRIKSEIGLNQADQSRMIAEQKKSLAEFARVLNTPNDDSMDASVMQGLVFQHPLVEPSLPSWEVVSAQAMAANPEIHARWAEVQRDQWRVKESRLNYYPDITYSAGWGVMTSRRALAPTADGMDNLTAGVSFNLPVRRAARDAALRESQSQVEKGIREWEREQTQTLRDVKQLHADLVNTQTQLEHYRETILPSLEQALEVTTTAYEANQVNLSELIDLRRELLKLRSTEKELQAQWHKLRADLSWLMADPL
jgi:outer membrane protein, heavy metal efflux system